MPLGDDFFDLFGDGGTILPDYSSSGLDVSLPDFSIPGLDYSYTPTIINAGASTPTTDFSSLLPDVSGDTSTPSLWATPSVDASAPLTTNWNLSDIWSGGPAGGGTDWLTGLLKAIPVIGQTFATTYNSTQIPAGQTPPASYAESQQAAAQGMSPSSTASTGFPWIWVAVGVGALVLVSAMSGGGGD